MNEALGGVRVLDFTQGMAGPLATMILADFGAEVIRVEPPDGDPMWSQPAYLLWKRGKKRIELDLASEQAGTLIRGADVLVESFRPGEADRLDIGYANAAALNPQLVYFSIPAFGQEVGCVVADGPGHQRFLHEDPHARATGFMVPTQHPFFVSSPPGGHYWRHAPVLTFSDTPCEPGLPFVALGEHTREIIRELGYSDRHVAQLEQARVIHCAASSDTRVATSRR
jgi:crotonobetainyl-CoA:carnitine CoA-transferase CaiB-like acyl-CoA transferase